MCSVIAGISAVCMISADAGRDEIERVEAKVQKKVFYTSLDVIQKVNQFEKEYQKTVDPNLTSMRPRALEEVYHSVEKKWKIIQQAYKNAGDHPGKYEWETFVRDGLSNVELLESAVGELAFGNSSEVPVW